MMTSILFVGWWYQNQNPLPRSPRLLMLATTSLTVGSASWRLSRRKSIWLLALSLLIARSRKKTLVAAFLMSDRISKGS